MGASRLGRVPAWVAALALLLGIALTASPLRTRAAFAPDDYRYLHHLREVDAGEPGAFWRGLVVENRWDDSWWIPDGTYVRFWRPLVLPSYALDRWLFGEDPRGFTASNLLWHALASLLVYRLLRELLGADGPALLGALLFAVGAARFEHTSYLAGRTDTFAGVGFFATLALYLRYRAAPSAALAAGVGAAFALALLAKEYCILAPLLFPLLDACVPPGRPPGAPPAWRRPALLAALALAALAYLGLRHVALGELGSGARPFPYFHLPSRPGFLEHVAATALQDGVYLTTGHVGPAFLTGLDELVETSGAVAVVAAAVVVPLVVVLGLVRGGAARFHALLFLLLLGPLLPLYSTGRYLYLPSLGWCGLVAGLLADLARSGGARRAGAWALGAAALLGQGWMHHAALARIPPRPAERGESDRVLDLLLAAGDFDPAGPEAYLIDAPLHWLHAQFLGDLLAVETGREAPVHVLSTRLAGQEPADVRVEGPRSLAVSRRGSSLVEPHPWGDFDRRALVGGERVEEEGYTATVLSVEDGLPTAVRFELPRPISELQVLQWRTWPGPPGFVRVP